MSGLREAALAHAQDGLRVLPLRPGGKEPLGRLVRHGSRDATSDVARVAAWWQDEPEANIGIATGRYADERHLVGLDLDRKNGSDGLASLRELNDSELPPTRTVTTPSGGRHMYFWARHDVRNKSQDVVASGICVKGTGGYLVAPASCLGNGLYVQSDSSPIADLPPRLLALLLEREGKPERPRGEPGDLRDWDRRDDFVFAALARMDIRPGELFRPWWRSGTDSSAHFYRDPERGLWICHDFGNAKTDRLRSMTLSEVYRAWVTDAAQRLEGWEHVLWHLRLLHETGFVPLSAVELELPLSATLSTFDRQVLDGFVLRWRLRLDADYVTFGARWGAEWIGQPGKGTQVSRTLRKLRKFGVVRKVGEQPTGHSKPLFHYALGDGTPDPSLAREGV